MFARQENDSIEPETIGRPLDSDSPPIPVSKRCSRASKAILVVDDEEILQQIMKHILESLGYTVHLAPDAESARALCNTPGVPVDMLITDIHMPDQSGPELA